MKITMVQRIERLPDSKFIAHVEVQDEQGQSVAKFSKTYTGRHTLYCAYKNFQHVLGIARRIGADHISIVSNIESFVLEIGGVKNVNSTLFNQTMERMNGITIDSVTVA